MKIPFLALLWICAFPLSLTYTHAIGSGSTIGPSVDADASNTTHGGLQSRNIHQIGSKSPRTPWPMTNEGHHGKLRVITYCFETLDTRAAMYCQIQAAMKRWQDALGGIPGPQMGHNLAFREVTNEDGSPAPCYVYWDPVAQQGPWDDDIVPDDALVIKNLPNTAESSTGYIPMDVHDGQGRHSLSVPAPKNIAAIQYIEEWIAMHEPILIAWTWSVYIRPWNEAHHAMPTNRALVLGMHHEDQRSDHQYIKFRCKKQRNYKARYDFWVAQGQKPESVHRWLCTDMGFATREGVRTKEFMVPPVDRFGQPQPVTEEGEFDGASVMLYWSGVGAEDFGGDHRNRCDTEVDEGCVLMQIRHDQGGALNFYGPPPTPSGGDISFVKKFYPWVGYADGQGPSGQHGGARKSKRSTLLKRSTTNTTVLSEQQKADGSTSYLLRVRKGAEVGLKEYGGESGFL
ncbi:hypothetical protein K458DRAFT_147378 [Lentithecium fluviatile CBS 122367]|uniref:Uncharacterized protein n=1 Tax=Lentithecium fluviatile CBS 122367 TaxID=1168545 RepID=A0A6G1JCU9_9PLEO|nr:hypothetical protein K458DRAFT_147378 [Lentithecium fluviatile CBS 122367]